MPGIQWSASARIKYNDDLVSDWSRFYGHELNCPASEARLTPADRQCGTPLPIHCAEGGTRNQRLKVAAMGARIDGSPSGALLGRIRLVRAIGLFRKPH